MSMSVLKKLSTILFPNTEEPYQISDPTAVKFDAQELTESQQMQARTNIAAVNNWEELGKKTGTVCSPYDPARADRRDCCLRRQVQFPRGG